MKIETSLQDLRPLLLELLRTDTVEITFIKHDGSERVMTCTLNSDRIPLSAKPKGTREIRENDEILRVYDLDNKGWRSFRLDTVIEWVDLSKIPCTNQ
jgi:hypothetical protein